MESNEQIEIVAKSIFTLLLIIISFNYFSTEYPWTFIDGANLLFHEAGHILWTFAGEFMMFLGGSLTQVFIPIGVGLYFMTRKSWYSVLFCLYWTGINLINVGVYIGDATAMKVPLIIDSAQHDWNYLLTQSNLLSYDRFLGAIVRAMGTGSILLAEGLMVREIFQRSYVFSHPTKL